jgi:hypothetical protein
MNSMEENFPQLTPRIRPLLLRASSTVLSPENHSNKMMQKLPFVTSPVTTPCDVHGVLYS